MEIRFFGMLVEVVGSSTLQIEQKPTSVLELKKVLLETYPKLNNVNFKVAVNQNLVNDDFILSNNDEVAFLPPFAGG